MPPTIFDNLLHVLIRYDRDTAHRVDYDRYDLPHYFERLLEIKQRVSDTRELREAIIASFRGPLRLRLLDKVGVQQ